MENKMQTVQINTQDITVKEFQGKRVVTLKDIDSCHNKPEGTARKRFNDNKHHFLEGVDYFKVPYNKIIESPPSARSIFDIPDSVEGYRGRDYSGYVFIAHDINKGLWKIGRTATQKTAEKRLNLSRVSNLTDYQYFDCLDTLKAIKEIQNLLTDKSVKNSWYDCDITLLTDIISNVIKDINANFEPRKKHKGGFNGDITLITESGYLMLVKSFTDDLAWDVQRQLVNTYFRVEQKTAADTLKLQIQQERTKAMLLNAQYRMLRLLMNKPELQKLSPVGMETLVIKAVENVTSANLGEYLPEVPKTYTATEVGNAFGVSANKVGKLANANGLKTEEYGITVLDKSRYSSKEVPTFRYNEKGKQEIGRLLGKIK